MKNAPPSSRLPPEHVPKVNDRESLKTANGMKGEREIDWGKREEKIGASKKSNILIV